MRAGTQYLRVYAELHIQHAASEVDAKESLGPQRVVRIAGTRRTRGVGFILGAVVHILQLPHKGRSDTQRAPVVRGAHLRCAAVRPERSAGGHAQHLGHKAAAERMPVLASDKLAAATRQLQVCQTQAQHRVVGAEPAEIALQPAAASPPTQLGPRDVDTEARRQRLQLHGRHIVEVSAAGSVYVVGYHVILATDGIIGLARIKSKIVAHKTVRLYAHPARILRPNKRQRHHQRRCHNKNLLHAISTKSCAVNIRRNIVSGYTVA